jgi:hypothetical protein
VPRTPDLKLHALWRDRVHRQADSGLTVAQFCAQQRLPVNAFHTWKRRLRLADCAGNRTALPARRAFLPVTVRVVDRASEELPPIEADLPNGVRLRIPTADARLACRLVRTVAGARTNSGGSR